MASTNISEKEIWNAEFVFDCSIVIKGLGNRVIKFLGFIFSAEEM